MNTSTGRFLLILTVVLFCASPAVLAQSAERVRVVMSSERELLLEVTPGGGIDTLPGGGLLPSIPMGEVLGGKLGDPVRMSVGFSIALPAAQGNSLEVVSVEYAPAVAGRLATLGEVMRSQAGADVTIGDEAPALSGLAELRYAGIARDLHVGEIVIAPWKYDRQSGMLQLLRSIQLRVRYAAPSRQGAAVESSAASAFLNAGVARAWGIGTTQSFSLLRPSLQQARAWMRVDVGSEGLYALTAADFQRAGIDLASARNVVIYGGNGEDLPEQVSRADSNMLRAVPALVERDGGGRITRLLFYGVGASSWTYRQKNATLPRHSISPFVRLNSYLVAVDGEPGRELQTSSITAGATHFPSTGIARVFVDDDLVNAIDFTGSGNGSGRVWFGPQFEVLDPSRSDVRLFETSLPGLDREGPITYRVRVAHTGRSKEPVASGAMTISEGSNQLGARIELSYIDSDIEGAVATGGEATYSLPRADAIGADNRSLLKMEYRSGVPARGFLDWYEIHYTRQLVAHDGEIRFEAPRGNGIAEYHIGGFGSDDLIGFDVTDAANPVRLERLVGSSGSFTFRGRLAETGEQSRRYYITEVSRVREVVGTTRAPFGDLRSRRLDAEILVITARELLPAAEKYAEYRRSMGRSVAVVPVDEIYTEFAHGNADPTAVRDYVAFAMKQWGRAPRFLVLFGGATYDYRGLIPGTRQFVPTMESIDTVDYYNDISSVAYDDYHARVVGNDRRIDLAIGRIPVGSVEEGESVIEKIRRYESERYFGIWRQTVILAADDDQPRDGAGGFVSQSEEIWAAEIPDWIDSRKIYLPGYPVESTTTRRKPEATRDLDQFIRRGALVTTWLGHGNPKVWGHENLLERDRMLPSLGNDTALTFVMAATCNFGSFDSRERTGAELFLLNPVGGAIGVLASTRASYTGPNSRLTREYMHQTFNQNVSSGEYPMIGEALYNVKQTVVDGWGTDNIEKYHILGDPVLALNVPEDRVVITAINGEVPSDSSAPLGALSMVTVEGEIKGVQGLRQDFNGTAIISLFEADRQTKLPEESEFGTYYHNVHLGGGRLFQGPAKIVAGRFSGTFRVPKEISFKREKGRLLAYAFNEHGDAAGATREVRIYGADTSAITDRNGPEIKVFLDDRSFRPGDMVTPSPLLIVELSDSSGVNSSTAGLGHGIEAYIDGDPDPIDLTDRYQTLPTSFQSGSAERRLDTLSPGRHEMRVRAWDIFNNPTETTTFFRVTERDDESLEVVDVVNIPNPMSRRTIFTFRHNQVRPLDVDVAIFTVAGRKVRDLSARGVVDRLAQVEWDGTDADGALLANGVYLYRLRVRVDEQVFETIEKVVVVR